MKGVGGGACGEGGVKGIGGGAWGEGGGLCDVSLRNGMSDAAMMPPATNGIASTAMRQFKSTVPPRRSAVSVADDSRERLLHVPRGAGGVADERFRAPPCRAEVFGVTVLNTFHTLGRRGRLGQRDWPGIGRASSRTGAECTTRCSEEVLGTVKALRVASAIGSAFSSRTSVRRELDAIGLGASYIVAFFTDLILNISRFLTLYGAGM